MFSFLSRTLSWKGRKSDKEEGKEANGRSNSIEYDEAGERPQVAKHDSTVLDLAFALDCTSSMSPYIRQAQQNIRQIVEEIVANEKSDIQLALIEYRDHPPQEFSFVTRVHDFTPSVNKMKAWLDKASARGGGDTPEAVADAWHDLLKLNWRPEATKICVHIADAPPHGLGLSDDGFQKGCPKRKDPVATMNKLAQKGVTLYMVGCEPSINPYKPFYMAMAHMTGGQYVPLTNATLLAQVIIGGAEEELCLEALMEEVEQEVMEQRAEIEEDGNLSETEIEEELSRRVHTKLNSRGVQSKQLLRNKEALPMVPKYAQRMAKHTNLADMKEDMMKNASVAKPDSSRAWETQARLPVNSIMRRPKVEKKRSEDNEANDDGFIPSDLEEENCSPVDMEACATPECSTDAAVDESYSITSAPLNLMQAQRMVKKAMTRSNAK